MQNIFQKYSHPLRRNILFWVILKDYLLWTMIRSGSECSWELLKRRWMRSYYRDEGLRLKRCWWRMKVERDWTFILAFLCFMWGKTKIGIARWMDWWVESVGFTVCSLWSFPPTVCRDCGLTVQAPRHTLLHVASWSFGRSTFLKSAKGCC